MPTPCSITWNGHSLPAVSCDTLPAGAATTGPEDRVPSTVPAVCDGIRPGARLMAPAGCTLAWILSDAEGNLYAATAGHCVAAGEGTPVDVETGGERITIGTVFFQVNNGEGYDFAVIRFDDAVKGDVNPAMCHWGGPVALAAGGDAGAGDTVRQYGHGIAISVAPETRARSASISYVTAEGYGFHGTVTNGDSGSPVMTADGKALGVLNTLGTSMSIGGNTRVHVGGADTLLSQGIALVQDAKNVELSLVTAPLADV